MREIGLRMKDKVRDRDFTYTDIFFTKDHGRVVNDLDTERHIGIMEILNTKVIG